MNEPSTVATIAPSEILQFGLGGRVVRGEVFYGVRGVASRT
jgi:hypothetical protein